MKYILDQVSNKNLITVISFNHRWLLEFKEICPDIQTTCLMFALPIDPIHIIKSCKASGMSLSVNFIDKKLVEECHEHKYSVTAWNANDQETYARMLNLGVDYLGTDVPYTATTWLPKN